ncbi:SH3 domain-containing protein [Cellulomonas bogoriensis]|uniref:SH3b domain-containing protein n=1 Tax=Cellulomonas bogoriensis 69B4 = DSM 16987 TaxID=1386082 RepID=A0A0A0BT63_9CELL|nr:SH3 domain-containing protein [Cellulomonas bogoriensis]KGM10872.1 hypothetical protein N869_04145 [Cellulomonas bogoriensis 69B4 = DSM 16987]
MRRVPGVLTATTLLLLAGCATEPGDAEPTDQPDPTVTVTETPDPDDTTDADDAPTTLPGEVVDTFPHDGTALAVVGVEHDDDLNVRSGPGVEFDVVHTAGPLDEEITATGTNRSLEDGSLWAEVQVAGTTGWVNTAFLSTLGQTDDVTSQLSERPSGGDPVGLGEQVAQLRADGAPSPRVTVADLPDGGDLGEVVVDLLGLPDDSVEGERLRVFLVQDGGTWTVRTVEATYLCSRGVTDELLCL